MGTTSGAGTAFAKNNRLESLPGYLHKLDYEKSNISTLCTEAYIIQVKWG